MSAIPWFQFQTLLFLPQITLHWHFSFVTQKRVRDFAKRYCNNIDIKLVFSPFKIGNMFVVKYSIPRGLRTCVVKRFSVQAVILAFITCA